MDIVYPDPFGGEPELDLSTVGALIDELELQAALLVAVATGGPRIDDVGLPTSSPPAGRGAAASGARVSVSVAELWQWYGYWTSGNLQGYRGRRAKIRELVAPTIYALEQQRSGLTVSDPGSGPLTWVDLDARLAGLVAELDGAVSRDDLQDVGRRAREILIDCAKLLADPSLVPAGQSAPKAADAKAWLDLFLVARAYGGRGTSSGGLSALPGISPRP